MINVLRILSLVCLALATIGIVAPVNLVALGLFLWFLSGMIKYDKA